MKMQREIKFRVWIKPENWMVYPNRNFPIYIDNSEVVYGQTLMQYTGLKDKNGVEIYEGDIVNDDGIVYSVVYGIQSVDAFEGVGFNLWNHYGDYKDIGKAIRLQSELEVIGNIYENPELLNENTISK